MRSDRILTLAEAARLLNAPPRMVESLLRRGAMRALRLDGEWRIARKDLEAFLNAHATIAA